jgi:chromosome segregation ATPase
MQERNISLENLANLNTNYSEIEKERDRYRGELDTEKTRYRGELDNLQKIIDTQKGEMALAQTRAQEAARTQAARQAEENARYAERQRQETEAARLRQIQGQQSNQQSVQNRVLNHPEVVKRRIMINQRGVANVFADFNYAKSWLDRSKLTY